MPYMNDRLITIPKSISLKQNLETYDNMKDIKSWPEINEERKENI